MQRKEAKSLGLKTYFTGKKCVNGHVSERRTVNGVCVECDRLMVRKYKSNNKGAIREQRKEYVAKNIEKIRDGNREWVAKNRTRLLAQRKERRDTNKEIFLERERKYNSENAERICESRREYYRVYMRNRRLNDVDYKVYTRMRGFVRRCVEAINGIKNWRTNDVLGYTPSELRKHIEGLWVNGMSWENYGEWHIDHIKSIKAHVDEGITDIRIVNALSNLQPLWAFDNLSKGA